MKVRDIAVKEVHCAEPEMDLAQIATMMKRHNVGVIPVCDGKKLMGMLTDRDLVLSCMASGADPEKCTARQFMTSHAVAITPDTEIDEAARIMGAEQLHRLPVVEDDELVGILSLGDIAFALDDDGLVGETLRRISTPTSVMAS